ncbi:hypothetical protein QQZ08_007022 [Neonectria magnoliae]|uniref:Uncharacterized protein n=1 Tax=Neonectria magnoliae TaxID=2732573 RepID=A0ABR1I0D4_9HYPO
MSHSPPVEAAEADVPVESERRQPSEGENTESQWLTVKSVKLADESKKDSELPHIEYLANQDPRAIMQQTLISYGGQYCARHYDAPERGLLMDVEVVDTRELIFRCAMSNILVGDLTNKAVELQANRLLHELMARQTSPSVRGFTPYT